MALIALATRLDGEAARRDKNCVKARRASSCSLSTTHFSSAENTILFAFVHYPQMLDHYRQTPSGGPDLCASPSRFELFFFLFKVPVDITEKMKCNKAVLTHALSLEEGTSNVLFWADYHHRSAFLEQH